MNWKSLLVVPALFVIAPALAVIAIVATLFIAVATGGGNGQSCAAVDSSVQTLEVTSSTGQSVTLGPEHLANARVIIEVAAEQKIPATGVKIALITTLVESKLKMYANSSVPESLEYPHQAVGSDHDSVNIFQQRPSSGWGTVAELMDVRYSARAFFGGPEGPNGGSPRGLLDIKDWESMPLGDAAQRVQVSAFPDRYEAWVGAAEIISTTLGGGGECEPSGGNGQAALPLNPPYMMTSGFGPRAGQGNASRWHAAVDLVNPGGACEKPVYAVLDGVVTRSDFLWLSIKHPDGFTVSYLHMYEKDHLVNVGDQVKAGQQIGVVGNGGSEQGLSFGCHLDLRIDVTGNTNPQVAQLPTVADVGGDPNWANFVHPVDFMRIFGIELLEAGQG